MTADVLVGLALIVVSVVCGVRLALSDWRLPAERDAAAVVAGDVVCSECQVVPVLVPGGVCNGCRAAAAAEVRAVAAHLVCPVCGVQRVPVAGAPCGVCLMEFHAELDRGVPSAGGGGS